MLQLIRHRKHRWYNIGCPRSVYAIFVYHLYSTVSRLMQTDHHHAQSLTVDAHC